MECAVRASCACRIFNVCGAAYIRLMYILAPERDLYPMSAFANYAEYLEQNRARFPPSAYALATSDWYFDSFIHHAPHDAWLESIVIEEPSSGSRREIRETAITIKLLGAYHDGFIELRYPRVFGFQLTTIEITKGHGDWRYDEFRVDEEGRLIHEIQWSAREATATWLIVASDVHHRWTP